MQKDTEWSFGGKGRNRKNGEVMNSKNNDLFFILLKLKSYIISIIDEPDTESDSFEISEEFLRRKHPEKADEILDILAMSGIKGDGEIAFDQKIHIKFKDIADSFSENEDLAGLLKKYDIELTRENIKESAYDDFRAVRDRKLKEIIKTLVNLARYWSFHSEIEESIDHLSELNDSELLRPGEEKKMEILDGSSMISFKNILRLTNDYLKYFVDYYFSYGGNISLEMFSTDLEKLKNEIDSKYSDLFKKYGLDFERLSDRTGKREL